MDYKAKVLQLEKYKVNWSKGKKTLLDKVVVVPSVEGDGPSIAGLVEAMSHVSLMVGEIKGLKGDIEKLKQEMQAKDERKRRIKTCRKIWTSRK